MTLKEKLEDIKNNPHKHKHTFAGLLHCCGTDRGMDGGLMEAHERYASMGSNGGRACDVMSGPCACGAWH